MPALYADSNTRNIHETPDLLQYQYTLILLLVGVLIVPVSNYLARICQGEPTILSPILRPVERGL